MKNSEITRPAAPTIMRIRPTVVSETPSTVAVTAYRRIAPTAIRNIDVPIDGIPSPLPVKMFT
jgi:hypothetical protein